MYDRDCDLCFILTVACEQHKDDYPVKENKLTKKENKLSKEEEIEKAWKERQKQEAEEDFQYRYGKY